MKQNAVIFDLDGTLIDSLEDLANSVNQALEENNYASHELEAYKYFIGDGAKVLIQRAIQKDVSEEEIERIHTRFKEIYKDKIDSKTKVYDGIYELLEKLEKQNYKKAILSNKPDIFTQDCVKKFFGNFDFVNISGQKKDIPKKPHPQAALSIASQLEVKPSNTFFVGDTKVDMQTAKSAGMIAIGVLWGFRDEKELRDNGADFIVKSVDELYNLLISDPYIPIACHFYDELESSAVKRVKSSITYLEDNEEKIVEDYLIDFKIIDKVEYAILKDGLKIRLDKIVDFNGLKPENYGCSV